MVISQSNRVKNIKIFCIGKPEAQQLVDIFGSGDSVTSEGIQEYQGS